MSRFFKVKIKAPPGGQLMMHNGALANPLNGYAKQMKTFTGKKKKSDDDHAALSELEFQGGLYFDDKLGPYVPGDSLDATIKNGAKKKKLGTAFVSSVRVLDEVNPLQYDGPRTRDGLWKDEDFRDVRGVRVQQSRVMRTRAKFTDWSLEFVVELFPSEINPGDVKQAILDGGRYVGLLEFRPRFGLFEIVSFDEIADPREAIAAE